LPLAGMKRHGLINSGRKDERQPIAASHTLTEMDAKT